MTAYHDAIAKCARRYLKMQSKAESKDEKLWKFTMELSNGAAHGMPIPKLCRWLGYIHGVLIERGLTTVEIERDWTRPLFRPLDFPEI